jgi:hypothetical protein
MSSHIDGTNKVSVETFCNKVGTQTCFRTVCSLLTQIPNLIIQSQSTKHSVGMSCKEFELCDSSSIVLKFDVFIALGRYAIRMKRRLISVHFPNLFKDFFLSSGSTFLRSCPFFPMVQGICNCMHFPANLSAFFLL